VTRAVVCDFGGVLTSPLIESFMAYQKESGVPFEELGKAMLRAAEKSGGELPLFALEKGEISEAEFLAAIEAELPGGTHLGSLRDTYFAHLRPNERMIDYMRELRGRGLRMALLTNNVREWEPHWRAKLPDIDEIFEVVVDSAFVGMRKPDPAIYELTLERLGGGVTAQDCVFIDDTDVNCDAAAALGMHPVHFKDAEQAVPEIEAFVTGE
jgi:epoxide hydrolase-like predicted phosphatase